MASNDEIITLVNENHVETVQRLARLETKLDAMNDLPERISKLENKNSWRSGAIAAISAVFSSGLTIISLRK